MLIRTNESVSSLQNKIFNNNAFGTPIYKEKIGDSSVFMVYEEYTFRNGNFMTLSIVIEDKEEFRQVHFVQSGSSRGLFGFDWGAGNSRVNRFIKLLENEHISYEVVKE